MSRVYSQNEPLRRRPRLVVLIPCYNEAATIAQVVREFQKELPGAPIYVFDNNSTDGTAGLAAGAGAVVVPVRPQGKGNVARALFRQVDADYYVMVDGDSTYPAASVHALIDAVRTGACDMAVGKRMSDYESGSFPSLHLWGNRMIGGLIRRLFRTNLGDVLSGYRCFSREVVKCIPILSPGFEVEAEITCRCLHRGFAIGEYPIHYGQRPAKSHSKLSTWRDGVRIVGTIARVFKDYKPLAAFTVLAAVALVIGLVFGGMVVYDWWVKSQATKIASAVMAAGMGLISLLLFSVGLLLDTLNRRNDELLEALLKNEQGSDTGTAPPLLERRAGLDPGSRPPEAQA